MKRTQALVVFFFVASASFSQPAKPVSPLDSLESLRGEVVIHSEGRTVVVALSSLEGAGDRLFKVETGDLTGQPISLRAASAQVFYLRGHLVVVAPRQGKALHFSIPGFDEPLELPALLPARSELVRIEATAIISRGGPLAFDDPGELRRPRTKAFYQDPSPGGGVGSCGTSCSITCGDGSTCSATCVPNRCASCTCPASCSCS